MKAYQVVLKGGLTRHIGAEGFREGREGLVFQMRNGDMLCFPRDEVILFEEETASRGAPGASAGTTGRCDRWGHFHAEEKAPRRCAKRSS